MMTSILPRMHRFWRHAVLAVLTLLLAIAASVVGTTATAPPARAHAFLLESNPVDSSVVDTPPERVYLRFDEPVTLSPQSIQLLDATGKRIQLPPAEHVDGNATTAGTALPQDLADGTYAIAWRVTSDDSHIVSGAVQFSIGAPSAIVVTTTRSDAVPAITQGVARGVAFLGLSLALGGFAFLQLMWSAGRDDRRARRIVHVGLVSLAVATVVIFLAQGPLATGESLGTAFSKAAWDATMGSVLGPAMVARLALLGVLAVTLLVLAVRRRRRGAAADRPSSKVVLGVAGAFSLAVVATWPLADHARSGLQKQLAIPATALHLLAMALWLGGVVLLVVSVLVLRRDADAEEVSAVHGALDRFSTVAQACFVVLAVTGVYLSWRQVGTAKALIHTNFGRLLLIKLAVVLAIVALAAGARAYVRRHRKQPVAHDPAQHDPARALRRLRARLGGEVVFGVAVLAVTAALVNTPPARTAYTPPFHTTKRIEAGPGVAQVLVDAKVQVDIKPARSGANVIDVYITGANGDLMRVREVTGQLQATRAGLTSLPVTITSGEPGHYVATNVSIPFPGRWELRLSLRTSDFEETPLPIAFTVR